MREVKFRQFFKDKFHYWGVNAEKEVDGSHFTGPLSLKDIESQQYTGLKDANGVEVYEGDIIVQKWIERDRYDSGEFLYGVIKFVNGRFVEAYKTSERQEDFYEIDGETCAVIGNIYQNPELLK